MLSDAWETRTMKKLMDEGNEAVPKVIEAFDACRPKVWTIFINCAFCTTDLHDEIVAASS